MADPTTPNFIERDPAVIVADMVGQFEQQTGRTLYPAQPERLLINQIAYRETLVREGIQDAALLNLVRYSRAPVLDLLGEPLGVYRLDSVPAVAQLRFSLAQPAPVTFLIPAGTRVAGGDAIFTTDGAVLWPAGTTEVVTQATAAVTGTAGNGWLPGQLNTLLDPLPYAATVANVTASSGGADEEDDEHLRDRILRAPASFSSAGPTDAYSYWAKTAHPDIVDVGVVGPMLDWQGGGLVSLNGVPPGEIRLYPLMGTGLPDSSVLAAVQNICSYQRRRPLTDYVRTFAPQRVPFTISAQLTFYPWADPVAVLALAVKEAESYAAAMRQRLGQDIVPTQVIAALRVPGVYDVTLSSPAAVIAVEPHQWTDCDNIIITPAGVANG